MRISKEKSEVLLWWVRVCDHAGLPQLTCSQFPLRGQAGASHSMLEPCVVHTCDPVKATLASNKTKEEKMVPGVGPAP